MWMVQLTNNELYSSKDCAWEDLPDFSILKIVIDLPKNKRVVLDGFESYIHIKECYKFVQSDKKNVLDTINVLGKYGDKVYQFSYNVRKVHAGQATNVWGKEFTPLIWDEGWKYGTARKTNHNLWHKGLLTTPTVVLV